MTTDEILKFSVSADNNFDRNIQTLQFKQLHNVSGKTKTSPVTDRRMHTKLESTTRWVKLKSDWLTLQFLNNKIGLQSTELIGF